MSVKLRLMRVGKTKQPAYRVVAADSRSPRDGRFIEILGQYNPRQNPSVINIDTPRAVAWLKTGAQPTERVMKLLKISGAWEAFETGVLPVVAAPVVEAPVVEAPEPAVEAPAEVVAEDVVAEEVVASDATES